MPAVFAHIDVGGDNQETAKVLAIFAILSLFLLTPTQSPSQDSMESTTAMPAGLPNKLVSQLLHELSGEQKSHKKLNSVTLDVAGEAMKIFVVEALQRAAVEARRCDDDTVTTKHVNTIMGQLLLDF
jgi:hypothetical protein